MIADAPAGSVLLVLAGIGLLGYGVWRLLVAFLDLEGEGDDPGGMADRAGALGSGASHVLLAALAFLVVAGSGAGGETGGSGGGGGAQETTAGILGWPGGAVIVGAIGVITIVVGGVNVHRGLTGGFMDRQRPEARAGSAHDLVLRTGRVGHVARGIVLGLIGAFFIRAAIQHDPSEAVGLSGALSRLAGRSAGPWLPGLVAAGLLAFAVFSVVEARYRRVRTP